MDKIVSMPGGKKEGPRSARICVVIEDLNDPESKIRVETEGQVTPPEVVFNLMSVVTTLTFGARTVGG